MKTLVTFQSLVVMLLLAVILELGLIAIKLPTPAVKAATSEPMPVYVVDGPLGRADWVRVGHGALKVEGDVRIKGGTVSQLQPVDVRVVQFNR